jgi:hypothetical protein
MRAIAVSILLALLCALPALAQTPQAPEKEKKPFTGTTAAEAELGKRTAEQIEKEIKLVKDEKAIARLNGIVAEIAPFTERPDVVYSCKILDTGALNAQSIPGGLIYITKGLLDAVESDHELAGVLAHEIAHNSLHHAKKLMERQKNASMVQVASMLALIYMNRDQSIPAADILTMSELVKQALVNGYTVELEAEADAHGVAYLAGTKKYDPVGLLSVILGFQQIDLHHPEMEMGYLKTHPYSDERRKALEKTMRDRHLPINLWNVVNFRATVVPPKKTDTGHVLRLGDVNLFTFEVGGEGGDAAARAAAAAAAINRRLLASYVQQYDVSSDLRDNQLAITIRGVTVFTLTDADATAANLKLSTLGAFVVSNIKTALWRELVKRA